jgi:hypothetical protein
VNTQKFSQAGLAGLLSVALLTACSSPVVNRSADEVDPASTVMTPDSFTEASGNLGAVSGLTDALPFGIRNELAGTTVRVSVHDVDPYDWLRGDKLGNPASIAPLGFTNVVLPPGDSSKAWFWPRSKSGGAPFELTFSMGPVKNSDRASMSFDELYRCFASFSGQQIPCTALFSVQQWYGWAWRSNDRKSVDRQMPQICNSTSAEFTYSDDTDGSVHRGRGRLECGSKTASSLGNSIVLEELK